MRLDDLPESSNIEDRRQEGGGGGFGGLPGGRGGLGIGTVVVLGLVGWALGIDPRLLIGGAELISGGGNPIEMPSPARNRTTGTPQDESGRFVARILGSTEVEWKDIFAKNGMTYRAPTLVMYSGATDARCGAARSAMGPFYCPIDERVYLDTSFFREIQTRFRGCDAGSKSCEFAQAYVIAHEVGHHVQKLLGTLPRVQQQQQAMANKAEANRLQVEVELQADCFAGVWANHSDQQWKLLEPGDVDAALRTAAAIGDDTLQKNAQGYAVPDSFTHGTSAQRQRWFNSGLKGGTVASCNTFGASQL
ncbi:MAG TPA: neutral zinc metallopeptidase [Xanthobacteraceae bacterium]